MGWLIGLMALALALLVLVVVLFSALPQGPPPASITALLPWSGLLAFFGTILVLVVNIVQAWRIEQFKTSQAEALEHVRDEIGRRAFARERLHERRIQVLAEIYEKIVEAEMAVSIVALRRGFFGLGSGRVEEAQAEAASAFNALGRALLGSPIWLDETTAAQLAEFHSSFLEVWSGIHGTEKTQFEQGWERLRSEIPPAKDRIEQRMKQLLGVLETNA